MQVDYTKALVTDPDMIALAHATQLPVKNVVAITNQNRYRSAYNKLQQSRMKVVRKLVREHPELLRSNNLTKEGE